MVSSGNQHVALLRQAIKGQIFFSANAFGNYRNHVPKQSYDCIVYSMFMIQVNNCMSLNILLPSINKGRGSVCGNSRT